MTEDMDLPALQVGVAFDRRFIVTTVSPSTAEYPEIARSYQIFRIMHRPNASPRSVPKIRLADQMAEQLQEQIKAMAPGTKLKPENMLAEEFGVSRTVVREAISQLKAVGSLRSRQGSGNFVAPPSQTMLSFPGLDELNPRDIIKFFEIRSGLDAAAARLASARRTKAQLNAMRQACQRTTEATNPTDAAASDLEFHQTIVEATANEHFVSVHRFLAAQLREGTVFTRRLLAGSELERDVHKEHRAIFNAIEAKDGELAAKLAQEHMLQSQHRLRMTLTHLAKLVD